MAEVGQHNPPPTPKRVKHPVPPELEFFHAPLDIADFIKQVYPHLLILANIKHYALRALEPDEFINRFVAYILEDSRIGIPRWQYYDPVRFPNQPYYRWFFSHFELFCRGEIRKTAKWAARHVSTTDETQTELLLEQAYHDLMAEEQTPAQIQQPLVDDIYWAEVTEGFEAFLAKYRRYEEAKAREAPHPTFSQHASELFGLMLDNRTNKDVAAHFGISPSAAMQWKSKLVRLARAWHWLQSHPEARAV